MLTLSGLFIKVFLRYSLLPWFSTEHHIGKISKRYIGYRTWKWY